MGTSVQKRASYERTRAVNLERDPYAAGGNRHCHRCGKSKHVTAFGSDISNKDGLRTVCKECRNNTQREIHSGGDYVSYRILELRPSEKQCSHCKRTKPLHEFAKQKAGKWGRNARCYECYNLHMRAQRFGLTVDHLLELWSSQGGRCAACSTQLVMSGREKNSAAVDHCHDTGAVRGLLCNVCNRALGMLEDSPSRVRGLYDYIRGA